MTSAAGSPTPAVHTLDTAVLTDAGSIEVGGDLGGSSNTPAAATEPTVTAPTTAVLAGPRLTLTARVVVDGPRWSASIPLTAARWGGPALPAPSGSYHLELRSGDAAGHAPHPTPELMVVAATPRTLTRIATVTLRPSDAALNVELAPPLTDAERGPAQQARLEAGYRAARPEPLDAVFFESFYGQTASCNPLALDREIAARHPHVTRYWSVVDASVRVPDGAIALIEGSEQWWNIRAAARLIVVNDWLRKRFRRRKHQTVLQTWHGTPLKRIALTRPGLRPRAAVATVLERLRWDALLSQNPYSSGIFRSAYAYLGSPWEEGYPRNDVLAAPPSAETIAALRERIGIPEGATVVLYAPTWRDDSPERVDQLDVAAFSAELGAGHVTLLRGHSRSLSGGHDIHASRVIDVTTYPDAAELFLVADVLVTDYSSVMFDFSVTGKPMYFFTPDLDSYRDHMRGFYFDLLAVSPGPVVSTSAELVAALRDTAASSAPFAARYAAWTARFNPRDDGKAANRVVRRLVHRGAIHAGEINERPGT
jgi:CDP-glycerol glycerophosphotransferase